LIRLDKLIISCDVVLIVQYHQKIRRHAIVIAGTTLHLFIYRTFSF